MKYDLYASEILMIEEIGEEDVMDIQVTGNNLFFANNILTHNSAIEAEKLSQAHIQGGISKINTSDYTVGIKQDDMMRAAGEIFLEILKSRNSKHVGKRILLGWDPISLTIKSLQKKSSGLTLNKKSQILDTEGTVFNKPKDDGILSLLNT